MKYSLRSLMRFSIRDIALATVIVALMLGWWMERVSMKKEIETLKWESEGFRDVLKRDGYEITNDGIEMRIDRTGGDFYIRARPSPSLPTSSSPAPNPPKP